MSLASTGVCTVLWSYTLSWLASPCGFDSDHIASPSSPLLRTKLWLARTFETPRCRFIPSAIESTTMLFRTVSPDIGPSNQSPTLVWWMYSRSTTEPPPSAPPIPFTWSVSIRSRTSLSIAKSDRCTPALSPSCAYLP
jgi:hypothetical protein